MKIFNFSLGRLALTVICFGISSASKVIDQSLMLSHHSNKTTGVQCQMYPKDEWFQALL